MSRLPRICPIGIAQHIIQRGNNRQICFVPSEYIWSSYQINALGKVSNLCNPHCLYTELGINDTERQATYRRLFTSHIEGELLEEIRAATKSGMALGNDRFKSELTSLTGRRLHTLPLGRKLGWRKS